MRSFGLDSSSFIAQPDFLAQQTEEGRWSASQSFLVKQTVMDQYTGQQMLIPGTPATTLDPDLPRFYNFLRFQNFDVRHMEAGWATITCNYTGFWSSSSSETGGNDPITYNLNGVTETVSILEHPKVVALGEEERALLNAILNGTASWNIADEEIGSIDSETGEFTAWTDQNLTSADGIAAAELITKGENTYNRPSYTWTESEESTTEFSASALNNLGKIDTPDGNPPEANGSRDWMLLSVDQLQRGTTNPVYSKTRVWLLSERGGHNEFLYGDTP